jgi:hypothetical protein
MKNTYVFVWIYQICKVQAIDDGSFVFDFGIIIFEVARDFFSHV